MNPRSKLLTLLNLKQLGEYNHEPGVHKNLLDRIFKA